VGRFPQGETHGDESPHASGLLCLCWDRTSLLAGAEGGNIPGRIPFLQ